MENDDPDDVDWGIVLAVCMVFLSAVRLVNWVFG